MIASQDGYLYVYSIPSVEGAECQLIKKHDLRLDDCYAIDVRGKLIYIFTSLVFFILFILCAFFFIIYSLVSPSLGVSAATTSGATAANASPSSSAGASSNKDEAAAAKSSPSSNSYAGALKTDGTPSNITS